MNSPRRLIAALGAMATAVIVAVLMPAYAWAADHPALVAAGSEVARRRPSYYRSGRGFGCGGFCCLLFIVLIVVVVLLVRRRRGPRQP